MTDEPQPIVTETGAATPVPEVRANDVGGVPVSVTASVAADNAATIRGFRPVVPDKPCLMCTHDYCECRTDQASFDAALAAVEQTAAEAEREAARTIAVVMSVHAEATNALMRRFIAEWKDGRTADITREEIEAAIKSALPEAVRNGIPDPAEYMQRTQAAEARAAAAEDALRQIDGLADMWIASDTKGDRQKEPIMRMALARAEMVLDIARAALDAYAAATQETGADT